MIYVCLRNFIMGHDFYQIFVLSGYKICSVDLLLNPLSKYVKYNFCANIFNGVEQGKKLKKKNIYKPVYLFI